MYVELLCSVFMPYIMSRKPAAACVFGVPRQKRNNVFLQKYPKPPAELIRKATPIRMMRPLYLPMPYACTSTPASTNELLMGPAMMLPNPRPNSKVLNINKPVIRSSVRAVTKRHHSVGCPPAARPNRRQNDTNGAKPVLKPQRRKTVKEEQREDPKRRIKTSIWSAQWPRPICPSTCETFKRARTTAASVADRGMSSE